MSLLILNRKQCTLAVLGAACLTGPLMGCSVAAQNTPVQPMTAKNNAAQGRMLHVSPKPLASVPAEAQFRTIAEAAQKVSPGDSVLIHTGVYRESVHVQRSGTKERPIRFEAAPAAVVTITGADHILEWRDEKDERGKIFSTPWTHDLGAHHPNDERHVLIGRQEQVFVNQYPLRQVLNKDQLSRGTFWVDSEGNRLYVWTTDNEKLGSDPDWNPKVEISVRPNIWEVSGEYVHTRGLRFRYAANRAQQPAARFRGKGNVIEDCIFERTNSIGAGFSGEDQVVRRCTFQDNGQMGWSAYRSHRLLFTGGMTRNNNIKNYSRGWEAGANKIVFVRGMIIEKSQFLDNRGSGVWFDIGNEQNTVRNCLIANNEDAGIFYEISYSLHAHDNVIVGNGLNSTGYSWGANGGIAISSSPDCVIERNLLIGNKEGFQFRESSRTTPLIETAQGTPEVPIWNHSEIIRNNVLAYNRDAQSWGWFDTKDERQWPAAMQTVAKVETGGPVGDMAADYIAKDAKGMPVNLSLEKLKFTFANNLYATQDNQELWNWGTGWRRNTRYTSLTDVQRELKLENGSLIAPFVFADYHTLDFRVPANSPALKLKAYPQGEIPGVTLGVLR